MKHLLTILAFASLAVGCASRTEDETGAAPDKGDATVTATDTASVPTDSTMGQEPSRVYEDTTGATAGADTIPMFVDTSDFGHD